MGGLSSEVFLQSALEFVRFLVVVLLHIVPCHHFSVNPECIIISWDTLMVFKKINGY